MIHFLRNVAILVGAGMLALMGTLVAYILIRAVQIGIEEVEKNRRTDDHR